MFGEIGKIREHSARVRDRGEGMVGRAVERGRGGEGKGWRGRGGAGRNGVGVGGDGSREKFCGFYMGFQNRSRILKNIQSSAIHEDTNLFVVFLEQHYFGTTLNNITSKSQRFHRPHDQSSHRAPRPKFLLQFFLLAAEFS